MISKLSYLQKIDLKEYHELCYRITVASFMKTVELGAERKRIRDSLNIESKMSEYERRLKNIEKKVLELFFKAILVMSNFGNFCAAPEAKN